VDLAGCGLKDVWGDCGLDMTDIEEILAETENQWFAVIPCELSLANTIVHGAVQWTKKWKYQLPKDYQIWLRLLEPVDTYVQLKNLINKNKMIHQLRSKFKNPKRSTPFCLNRITAVYHF